MQGMKIEELMKQLAPIMLERCMQDIAQCALEAANVCPPEMNGPDALRTFSESMLNVNHDIFNNSGLGFTKN